MEGEGLVKHSEEFLQTIKAQNEYARNMKREKGAKIVGTLCTYAPEEMIMAAGAHPLRLFGSGEKIRLADSHLQSYCCSLGRGVLEDALSGQLDFLDGVVFGHTCDTMQRLSDIWRLNVGRPFHLDVVLPVKLDTASSRHYFIAVLRRFREELGEKLEVDIADGDLRKAISTGNRIRKSLGRIYDLISGQPGIISGDELYALNRAAVIMDRTRLAEILEETVREMARIPEERQGQEISRGVPKRVFLAGGVCSHPDIYKIIEDAKGAVTGDDLCTGSRYFHGLIDETNPDPVAAIADRYLERAVCPAKHRGIDDRSACLVRMATENRAAGVIFFFLKFCDPHAFDYPCLRDALEKAGIPSMLVEVEDRLPAEGQLRTRIEAFIEMI